MFPWSIDAPDTWAGALNGIWRKLLNDCAECVVEDLPFRPLTKGCARTGPLFVLDKDIFVRENLPAFPAESDPRMLQSVAVRNAE